MNQPEVSTVLLHGDIDAIKNYVFETSSLPQIRGGSQLLVECEEEIKEKLKYLGASEIYCSGGSFLFAIPENQVKQAKHEIERVCLEKTGAATLTVVYEQNLPPDSPDTSPSNSWAQRLWQAYLVQDGNNKISPKPFARRIAFLVGQLREAKAQKTQAPFWEAPPFGLRCDLCGKRVAAQLWRSPEGEEKRVCPVCWIRYKAGSGGGQFNDRFKEWAERQGLTIAAKRPVDLDHLVESARSHQYLAFVYADGNDIGGLLQRVNNEEELGSLSKILSIAAEDALFEALGNVCGQVLSGADYWPFEIIHIGGDDVTLLIQAGYAWEVAVEFLKQFEEKVNQRLEERLKSSAYRKITASIGIAVADAKYPVRYLAKLAEDILKKAKRRAKENPQNPCSTINFLWLPSPVAAESADPLLSYYEPRQNVVLTARPYTLEEAKSLVVLMEQATKMPRSLRHRWAEALEKGLFVSLNTIYYDIARRKAGERHIFQSFLQALGHLAFVRGMTKLPAPVWTFDKSIEKWRTALLDVLELTELRATRPDVEEISEESV